MDSGVRRNGGERAPSKRGGHRKTPGIGSLTLSFAAWPRSSARSDADHPNADISARAANPSRCVRIRSRFRPVAASARRLEPTAAGVRANRPAGSAGPPRAAPFPSRPPRRIRCRGARAVRDAVNATSR